MPRIPRSFLLMSASAVLLASSADAAPISSSSTGGHGGGHGGFVDPISVKIAQSPFRVGFEVVTSNVTSPVYGTHAGDGSGRLFVLEQPGVVRVIKNGKMQAQPFLDMRNRVVPLGGLPAVDERGLLGIAFHPNFATNGKFYTYHSAPVSGPADFTVNVPSGYKMDHQGVIAEWRVDPSNPSRANPGSYREIMRFDQPQFNHNGGTITFGPDRNLYVSLGDGGGADDQDGEVFAEQPVQGHGPNGNGQNLSTVLGKVLRIDVDGRNSANGQYGIPADNPFVGQEGALGEIYAYGLRNPYRMSFDPLTGQLIAGDVGQYNIEEINIITAGGNYGWRLKEGTFIFNPGPAGPGEDSFLGENAPGFAGLIDPLAQYDHDDGHAVVGGFTYRAELLPKELIGDFIFGDFHMVEGEPTGRVFSVDLVTGALMALTTDTLGGFVKGFGLGAMGDIYVMLALEESPYAKGRILRLVPAEVPEPAAIGLLGLGLAGLGWARRRKR